MVEDGYTQLKPQLASPSGRPSLFANNLGLFLSLLGMSWTLSSSSSFRYHPSSSFIS